MKRVFLMVCLLAVIVCCGATSALADISIITPQEGETLPVKNGMLHAEWDIGGIRGEWVIISYETFEILLRDNITKGMDEVDIRVNDMLKENEWYFFAISTTTGETDGRYFKITYGDNTSDTQGDNGADDSEGVSLYTLSYDDDDGDAEKLITDAYNDIVHQVRDSWMCWGSSAEYIAYPAGFQDVVLSPTLYYFPERWAHGSYGDLESLEKDFGRLVEYMHRRTTQLSEEEGSTDPAELEAEQLTRGKVRELMIENSEYQNAFVPLESKKHNLVDTLLFGVILENGEWVDNSVYLVSRTFVNNQAVMCLITDQEIVQKYMEMIGVDKQSLTADLKIINWLEVPDEVQPVPVQAYGEMHSGKYIADAYNGVIGEIHKKGYGTASDSEAFYYMPTDHSALINPTVLVLSGENSAGKTTDQTALEMDFRKILEISVESSLNPDTPDALTPIAADIAKLIAEEKVRYIPVGYALGDVEYFVFSLINTESGERMEDQFYLLSRILSEGGTAHLCLFADHVLVEQVVSSDKDRINWLVPACGRPSVGPPVVGIVKRTTGGAVNVRAGFTADTPKITMIKPGEEFVCIGIAENGWYQILLPDGQIGYVSHKMVDLLPGGNGTVAGNLEEEKPDHIWSKVSYNPKHPHAIILECDCGAQRIPDTNVAEGVLGCCECVGHNWCAPINTSIGYVQNCSVCKAQITVVPSKDQFMAELFEMYRQIGVSEVFEETALIATNKLTEKGFVYFTETINATKSIGKSLIEKFPDVIGKTWDSIEFETFEGIAETIIKEYLGQDNVEAAKYLSKGELRDMHFSLMDEPFVKDEETFENLARVIVRGVDSNARRERLTSEWEALICDMLKSNYSEEISRAPETAIEELNTVFSETNEILGTIKDANKVIKELDGIPNGLKSVMKEFPNAVAVFDVFADSLDTYEEEVKFTEFVKEATVYAKNVEKIAALMRAAEATGNTELFVASENVYNRMKEKMENQLTTMGETGKTALNSSAVNFGSMVINGLAKEIPALNIISSVGTVADVTLDWGSAYESAISLQYAGLMNTIIKDDISKMFEEDGEAAYQLTELYTELQIEGLKRTGQFLQDYENARVLNVEEFGINDAQLKETLNGLDTKIDQLEGIQHNLYETYYGEWNSTAQ